VSVRLRERATSRAYDLNAPELIAANGSDIPIREALGITRSGVGHLMAIRSVLVHCPEADAYLASGIQQFEIEQPASRRS
jgi:putative polyketide hydroxylase